MKRKLQKPTYPLFSPQDRYYVNAKRQWWFFTVDRISGPYADKNKCVVACRYYIKKRDGIL